MCNCAHIIEEKKAIQIIIFVTVEDFIVRNYIILDWLVTR